MWPLGVVLHPHCYMWQAISVLRTLHSNWKNSILSFYCDSLLSHHRYVGKDIKQFKLIFWNLLGISMFMPILLVIKFFFIVECLQFVDFRVHLLNIFSLIEFTNSPTPFTFAMRATTTPFLSMVMYICSTSSCGYLICYQESLSMHLAQRHHFTLL